MLLTKICILSAIIGIILLIIIGDKVEAPSSTINSIKKEDVNKPIKIIGVSKNIINKGKLTKIELEDKSGKIDIIVFNSKKIPIKKGSTIEAYGTISVYENKPQIYAETIKIIN